MKNTRPFAGLSDGLIGVKLAQLVGCDAIDRVLVSTNDAAVLRIAERFAERSDKVVIDLRPDHLCMSSTSTDEVIEYVPSIVPSGAVLWTHVTSPLVDGPEYARMIDAYFAGLATGAHDSLMAVTTLRNFLWNEREPVNYDRNVEKWPRTQTLKPLYMINSAAFIADVELMKATKDRIGGKPLLHVIDEMTAFEVDWEDQFHIAERLYATRFGQAA